MSRYKFVGKIVIYYKTENYHKPKVGIKLVVRPGDWWYIDIVTRKNLYIIPICKAIKWKGDKRIWWLIGIGKEKRYTEIRKDEQ